MLNKAILMGRLTADPELKQTPSGVSVVSFTLAVERAYAKNKEDRQTDFLDIVAWRGTAEFVSRYFSKGQLMALEGRIQTRAWEDKQGNKRKSVEIVADEVHFTGDSRKKEPSAAEPPALWSPGPALGAHREAGAYGLCGYVSCG